MHGVATKKREEIKAEVGKTIYQRRREPPGTGKH